MRHRLHGWQARAEALACTGTPGVYRVLIFAFVQHIYSLSDLGHAASDFAIAQLASYFTAIGWASLILVRVPMARERRQAVDAFYAVGWMAGASTLVVSCAAGIVLVIAPGVFDVQGIIFLMWGWSTYQLARHYFVARKSYRAAVFFDVLLIGCSYGVLYVCRAHEVSSSVALSLALGMIALVMFAVIGLPSRTVLRQRFDTKGLQFGMTNFLSGGITLLLVPLASRTCGAAFAGGFSLLSSVTAVAILLPRAIATTQLSSLAKLIASGARVDTVLHSMRKIIWKSNVAVFGANAFVVVAAVYWRAQDMTPDHRVMLIVAGLLLAAQYAVSMGGTVSSSVMMVFEKARETTTINLKTTAMFASACGVFVLLGGFAGFLGVLGAAVFVSAARNALVSRYARRAVHTYENTTAVTS